jgi:hypothetical protein
VTVIESGLSVPKTKHAMLLFPNLTGKTPERRANWPAGGLKSRFQYAGFSIESF